MSRDMLEASITAGESGPVIVLSGEADQTCAWQLNALINGQISDGVRQLTIDLSGLRFADTASIRTLVLAAKALKERNGDLVLLHPQQPVARTLALTGADQLITIRATVNGVPQPAPHLAAFDKVSTVAGVRTGRTGSRRSARSHRCPLAGLCIPAPVN